VVDGRAELGDEARAASADLQEYLKHEFEGLLSNRDFLDALPGHLLSDTASQQRLGLVLKHMHQFVERR
jgi:hypothetical protein